MLQIFTKVVIKTKLALFYDLWRKQLFRNSLFVAFCVIMSRWHSGSTSWVSVNGIPLCWWQLYWRVTALQWHLWLHWRIRRAQMWYITRLLVARISILDNINIDHLQIAVTSTITWWCLKHWEGNAMQTSSSVRTEHCIELKFSWGEEYQCSDGFNDCPVYKFTNSPCS